MTEITLQLPNETYRKLSEQALQHGLSTEDELKRIIDLTVQPASETTLNRNELLAWAKELSHQMNTQQTNSTDILRELREQE